MDAAFSLLYTYFIYIPCTEVYLSIPRPDPNPVSGFYLACRWYRKIVLSYRIVSYGICLRPLKLHFSFLFFFFFSSSSLGKYKTHTALLCWLVGLEEHDLAVWVLCTLLLSFSATSKCCGQLFDDSRFTRFSAYLHHCFISSAFPAPATVTDSCYRSFLALGCVLYPIRVLLSPWSRQCGSFFFRLSICLPTQPDNTESPRHTTTSFFQFVSEYPRLFRLCILGSTREEWWWYCETAPLSFCTLWRCQQEIPRPMPRLLCRHCPRICSRTRI